MRRERYRESYAMRRCFLAGTAFLLLAGCTVREASPPRPAAVVFFSEESVALDDAAQRVVAGVAAEARSRPGPVRVLGFAGAPGSAGFNRALSDARARNVADGLRDAGVPAERIRVEPRGAVPFEAIPTESRRVEIVVGG